VCAAENPNRRLRMTALADRVATPVERADFDDLVTLVTQAPPWEKDRAAGARIMLRAIGDGKATAPEQILQRWTWRLTRSVRKTLDRKASQEFPEGKRLLGAVANSRGHRHEENIAQLAKIAKALPLTTGAALLASAEGYTPRATQTLDAAREALGPIQDIAGALADDLPAPKAPARKSRRRRKKKRPSDGAPQTQSDGASAANGDGGEPASIGDDPGAAGATAGTEGTAEPGTSTGGETRPRRRRTRRPRTDGARTAAAASPEPGPASIDEDAA
jgi:hypothetical protein